MNDVEFDQLMARAGRTPAVARSTSADLIEETRRNAGRAGRARGRRVALIGTVSVAGLCLAAAASSQLWSKMAPFTELSDGMYRPTISIPVDFTMSNGHAVRCQLFPEFVNLSVAESKDADKVVTGHDWSHLGQKIYDASIAPSTDGDTVQSALTDPLIERVRSVALRDMPYLAASPVEGDTTHETIGPAWSGFSLSCGSSFAK